MSDWTTLLWKVAEDYAGLTVREYRSKAASELLWRREGWSVLVRFPLRHENTTRGVRADFQFVNPLPALRVKPEGIWSQVRRLFGSTDLETGDADFDGWFQISASPPEFARKLLDLPTRQLLMALDPEHLDIAGSQAWLVCGPPCDTEKHLRRLADLLGRLGERLTGWDEPEITVVPRSGGTCQVCGSPMSGKAVLCRKCRTPHHPECWEYLGSCSTFACGSKEQHGRN